MSSVNAHTTFLLAGSKSVDFGGNSAAYQSKQLGGRSRRNINTKRNKKINKNKRNKSTKTTTRRRRR